LVVITPNSKTLFHPYTAKSSAALGCVDLKKGLWSRKR